LKHHLPLLLRFGFSLNTGFHANRGFSPLSAPECFFSKSFTASRKYTAVDLRLYMEDGSCTHMSGAIKVATANADKLYITFDYHTLWS
jgi:hypothetical protein